MKRLAATTLTVMIAAVALTGCAAPSPQEKAESIALKYGDWYLIKDSDVKPEELLCSDSTFEPRVRDSSDQVTSTKIASSVLEEDGWHIDVAGFNGENDAPGQSYVVRKDGSCIEDVF